MVAKTYIIAEIGINHEGNVHKCLELIKKAKLSGVNAVKLQTIDADLNYSVDTPSYKIFKSSTLSIENTAKVFKFSKEIGLDVFTTVGDIPTAKWVKKLKPSAWKVSSSLLTHIPLIEFLAKNKEPLFISTGLAIDKEIIKVIKVLKKNNKINYSLLHCTSIYPSKLTELNLHKITEYKKKFKVKVGYSDHSIGSFASSLAVANGAEVIEKHFSLDNKRNGYDHKISLNFNQMQNFVRKIRKVEKIMKNDDKKLNNLINKNRTKFLRVVVANKDIKKGLKLNKNNIAIKRVNNNTRGVLPEQYHLIINKKIKKDVKKDELISTDLIM